MRPVPTEDLDHDSWLLLHEVRLRGVFEVDGGVVVTTLIESGLISESARGVRITPAGRDAHAVWARVEPGSELEATIDRAYRRFLTINTELIRLCSDWQVRPGGMPNDHKDPEYDWGIFDRLSSIDDRVGPLVSTVARSVDRFSPYRELLRTARQKVDDGGHDWLTSPRIDSYHTVWMQLHEDLLLALGKERASES